MIPVSSRILLAFVVLLGFCARGATYKTPLLDHHAWRQADTAAIARNFYRERFNIFYPQIDQRGGRADGYVETGLEALAFVVAALSRAGGSFHYETGRILSALCFIGSALLLWRFVQRRYGERIGLTAVFLYAFAFPLTLFIERAFMNEALLLMLSFACLVSAQSWLQPVPGGRSPRQLLALLTASSLIAAIKVPYLIIWAPIAGLFIEQRGWRVFRSAELWLLAIVNLAVAGAWYTHAHQLAAQTGLTFGLSDKLFEASLVFSPAFPARIFERLVRDVLTPVGLVAAGGGLWVAARERRWCEPLGVAGFVAYLLIVARGNFHHDYYQLPIMPAATVLAALGAVRGAELIGGANAARRDRVLASVLALALIAGYVRAVSANSWYEYDRDELAACDALRRETSPQERVVMIGNNNPQLLVCIDRKGWLYGAHEVSVERARAAWDAGASIAIMPRAVAGDEVRRFLMENGTVIVRTERTEAYRLEPFGQR
jgi:hypothetical protein